MQNAAFPTKIATIKKEPIWDWKYFTCFPSKKCTDLYRNNLKIPKNHPFKVQLQLLCSCIQILFLAYFLWLMKNIAEMLLAAEQSSGCQQISTTG